MDQAGCGRDAVWGGCEDCAECLINSHFCQLSDQIEKILYSTTSTSRFLARE